MRIACRFQVYQYDAHPVQHLSTVDDPLHTPFAHDYAIRDYKSYLMTERQAKPTSVNLALAAINHFRLFLGSERAHIQRESFHAVPARALKPNELLITLIVQ